MKFAADIEAARQAVRTAQDAYNRASIACIGFGSEASRKEAAKNKRAALKTLDKAREALMAFGSEACEGICFYNPKK